MGTMLGYITQSWSLLRPLFKVKNAAGQTVLRIEVNNAHRILASTSSKLASHFQCQVDPPINNDYNRFSLLQGPVCTFSLCGSDVKFKVMSRDSTVQVGTISKQWSGLLNELLTDADHFCVSFPMDLDVNIKAVLLGAVFLIVSRILFLMLF